MSLARLARSYSGWKVVLYSAPLSVLVLFFLFALRVCAYPIKSCQNMHCIAGRAIFLELLGVWALEGMCNESHLGNSHVNNCGHTERWEIFSYFEYINRIWEGAGSNTEHMHGRNRHFTI